MSPPHEPRVPLSPAEDDPRLVNYLLGLLPDEEAEPIDEASVADDDVAWQLRASEYELVDAYVSGVLPADTRRQFERVYLTSPRRREKVRIAEGLLAVTRQAPASQVPVARARAGRASSQPAPADPVPSEPARSEPAASPPASSQTTHSQSALRSTVGHGWRLRFVKRPNVLSWGCLAAAVLLLVVATVLVFHELRLRDALGAAQVDRAAFDRRAQELEQRLGAERAAQVETMQELVRVRAQLADAAKQAAAAHPPTLAQAASARVTGVIAATILLRPQTRAAGDVPMLAMRPDAVGIPVTLLLESQGFPRYRVTLKDPGTATAMWRSSVMAPATLSHAPVLPLVIPARVLRPQYYSLDVSGIGASGDSGELVGSYTFRIVQP